jgi:hypothetical protein
MLQILCNDITHTIHYYSTFPYTQTVDIASGPKQ